MRGLQVVLVGVALLVGAYGQPANAGKGTDFEQFVKRTRKCVVDDTFSQKPRSLCVCQHGGLYHAHARTLVYSGELGDSEVTVQCYTRT